MLPGSISRCRQIGRPAYQEIVKIQVVTACNWASRQGYKNALKSGLRRHLGSAPFSILFAVDPCEATMGGSVAMLCSTLAHPQAEEYSTANGPRSSLILLSCYAGFRLQLFLEAFVLTRRPKINSRRICHERSL
jgi:hypothetical protein